MEICHTVADIRKTVAQYRGAHETVGLVATMGALHDGHLALVRQAKSQNARVVATIFVNPTQFGDKADLTAYPSDTANDITLLQAAGVDALFLPNVETMYPEGDETIVETIKLANMLHGKVRPGHFRGVTTVVARLFNITLPDAAYFGEKDYQQLQVVRRMAADLDIPIEVVGCPTIREEDGLAMSSRNLLLSDRSRIHAPVLAEVMGDLRSGLLEGAAMSDLRAEAEARIMAAGFNSIDYIELRDGADLSLLDRTRPDARLFAAAWLAGVRLIDNIAV